MIDDGGLDFLQYKRSAFVGQGQAAKRCVKRNINMRNLHAFCHTLAVLRRCLLGNVLHVTCDTANSVKSFGMRLELKTPASIRAITFSFGTLSCQEGQNLQGSFWNAVSMHNKQARLSSRSKMRETTPQELCHLATVSSFKVHQKSTLPKQFPCRPVSWLYKVVRDRKWKAKLKNPCE